MKPSKQSRQLAGALVEDHKRQAVDAAKKRAVAQQVDYETFKNMVSVAHLKPLQAPMTPSAGGLLPAWALDPTGVFTATQATVAASVDSTPPAAAGVGRGTAAQLHVPQNSQEFVREWRRNGLDSDTRYKLLRLCGAAAVAEIFRVEITGELLGQLLLVLQEEWCLQGAARSYCARSAFTAANCCAAVADTEPSSAATAAAAATADDTEQLQPKDLAILGEALFVVELLHGLTGAGRFDLNAKAIGSKAKQAATQLCSDIEATLKQHQRLDDHIGTGSSSHTGTSFDHVELRNSSVSEHQADGVCKLQSAAGSNSAVQQPGASSSTATAGSRASQQQMQAMQSADISCQSQQQGTSRQALTRLAVIRQKLGITAASSPG